MWDHDDTAADAAADTATDQATDHHAGGAGPSPTVRSAAPADHAAILALWDAAGMLDYVAEPEADLQRTAEADPGLVLVAEDRADHAAHGGVVGTVMGTWDGRRGWVMRLAVDPAARRGGVGRALVAELEDRLRRRGADRVNLLVFADNRGGLSFWQELGYRATAPVVLMTRRLDG